MAKAYIEALNGILCDAVKHVEAKKNPSSDTKEKQQAYKKYQVDIASATDDDAVLSATEEFLSLSYKGSYWMQVWKKVFDVFAKAMPDRITEQFKHCLINGVEPTGMPKHSEGGFCLSDADVCIMLMGQMRMFCDDVIKEGLSLTRRRKLLPILIKCNAISESCNELTKELPMAAVGTDGQKARICAELTAFNDKVSEAYPGFYEAHKEPLNSPMDCYGWPTVTPQPPAPSSGPSGFGM